MAQVRSWAGLDVHARKVVAVAVDERPIDGRALAIVAWRMKGALV